MKNSMISPYSNLFYFNARDSFDIDKVIGNVAKVLDTTVMCLVREPEEDETKHIKMYIKGESTQGVEAILLKNGIYRIILPWLSSRTDVSLAFTLIREAKKLCPELVVFDGDDKTFADVSEKNEAITYNNRIENMRYCIELQCNQLRVDGIIHEFYISPEYIMSRMPDYSADERIQKTFENFVAIQWDYEDYDDFDIAEITSPDGEDTFTAVILVNKKGFGRECQKVALHYDDKQVKIVPIEDFFAAVKDNPYVKRLDYAQFVIDRMPDKEWKVFYDSFDVEPVRAPKTYLLRWNPLISSFRLEEYRDVLSKYPDGFAGMNWSIYEWEDAHIGDYYYMLRTGDDKAGIVFRGVFTSEPYKGEDWAGKGRERYYMDMECYDCVPADEQSPVGIDVLEKNIPSINWRRGHSGELLSEDDAEKLDDLFYKFFQAE